MTTVRIGAGAGYAGDRIQPAVDLIEHCNLNYIVFECLAERTIALAQQAKSQNPNLGYDPMLEARMAKVLPACLAQGTRVISNMGAANPIAAARKVAEIAGNLNCKNLKIAAVTGDNVLPLFESADFAQLPLLETGAPVSSLASTLLSANAYIGADSIREALAAGAHIVLGGRIADPSLFLAPLLYEFGWSGHDYEKYGRGILIGHLLECAGQLSGGYFADPPYKQVPGITNLGFPYADVSGNGHAVFSKWEGSGGNIDVRTCKEQLLYEIHDTAAYLTPDVTADFSGVELEQIGPSRVRVTGGSGSAPPKTLKVSLGYREGYIGEGQISYAGSGAEERGKLAIDIVREQLRLQGCAVHNLRCDLIGVNSVRPTRAAAPQAPEVRVRIAGQTETAEEAAILTGTVEALYTNGPAAGGGVSKSVRPVIAIASTLIPRECVSPSVYYQVTS